MPTLEELFRDYRAAWREQLRDAALGITLDASDDSALERTGKALAAACRAADAVPPWLWLDADGKPVTVGDRVKIVDRTRLSHLNEAEVIESIYLNRFQPLPERVRVGIFGTDWDPHNCRKIPPNTAEEVSGDA